MRPLPTLASLCPSTTATAVTHLGSAMFKRRIGPAPHEGNSSGTLNSCPDIWELDSGDFAIIGMEKTAELTPHLPADAFVDPGESIVVLPRNVLLKARDDIPTA
jgi:hypothetical protein